MATIKTLYGTAGQTVTITATGITNGSSKQSDAIDNSTDVFLDALVHVTIKAGSSGTAAGGVVNVYAAGTVDGGTKYSGGASGTAGSYTPVSPTQLRLIGQVNVVADSATYEGGPFSVAGAFGGILPQKWVIVLENVSGATLDASVGAVKYQGIYQQVG